MHRQFRKLLETAEGQSKFVLAANLDIRGFSDWSRRVESRETILYLTKIYPRLIDQYFKDRWFFKPTGDGLLLVRAFEEPELGDLVGKTIRDCFEIVESFATLCADEPMVNFETPSDVGIGLAQGAASRLTAPDPTSKDGTLILDYSGRVLNLASRLMELARPRGIVIDAGFGSGLIPAETSERLQQETGYIRGVSPEDEVEVFFDPTLTKIPDSFRHKPGEVEWRSVVRNFTLRQMEEHIGPHLFRLDGEPSDPNEIRCTATHPAVSKSGRRLPNMQHNHDLAFDYRLDGRSPTVSVDFPTVAKTLRDGGVKGPWPITIRAEYTV